ncbi:MAG: hypothetical protein ACSW75_06020 [Lachnospiraceae bacterium]
MEIILIALVIVGIMIFSAYMMIKVGIKTGRGIGLKNREEWGMEEREEYHD